MNYYFSDNLMFLVRQYYRYSVQSILTNYCGNVSYYSKHLEKFGDCILRVLSTGKAHLYTHGTKPRTYVPE